MKRFSLLALPALLLFACQTAETPDAPSAKYPPLAMCATWGPEVDALGEITEPVPMYEGLGELQFDVTSSSEEAKAYFLQGYKLANAFNHLEAARSFRYAAQLDPDCAMCHWGLAYVLGPNYNAAMEPDAVPLAYAAIQKAAQLAPKASPSEQAIIAATAMRYNDDPASDRAGLDQAYADALKAAHQQFPDDTNIAALYAEALMNLHPWDIWQKDGSPHPWTAEILAVIESILAADPGNIVANHMYIHATEASNEPQKALVSAARLPGLAPGAGHLVHMPSHTYIRTGDYRLGSIANLQSILADSAYLSQNHAGGPYPLGYFPHNYHFLVATAALEGNSAMALEAAERMARQIDTVMMREPVMSTLQHYRYIPLYTMVKFGKWADILAQPRPAADLLYPNIIWRYARGMAFLGKGDADKARMELAGIDIMKDDHQLEEITIWYINNAGQLAHIASHVLAGEIALAEKRYDEAVALFREAVALEDALKYNEPPDWFFSVRHHLGDALLAAGRYAEAEDVYETDLRIFPKNGWALSGLVASLEGQKKNGEAKKVRARFETAWTYADGRLNGSKWEG
jgi:tetratricopeptide (TPR) repeat protein